MESLYGLQTDDFLQQNDMDLWNIDLTLLENDDFFEPLCSDAIVDLNNFNQLSSPSVEGAYVPNNANYFGGTTSPSESSDFSDSSPMMTEEEDEEVEDPTWIPEQHKNNQIAIPRVRECSESSSTSSSCDNSVSSCLNGVRRRQNRKCPNVAHWLRDLVVGQQNKKVIDWEDEGTLTFKIIDQNQLAKMWGEHKNRQGMTYNNLSRTMRYHYGKSRGQELKAVPKKLVYKFSKHFGH